MTLAKRLSAGVPIRECSFVTSVVMGSRHNFGRRSRSVTTRLSGSRRWSGRVSRWHGLDEHRDRREDT
jgi:hypothetical protein